MKRVLLVGNGAREHVIGETLRNSGAQVFTYAQGRNPGLVELSEGYESGNLKDLEALRAFAKQVQPDFAVVGPDDPIADGAADALLADGIRSMAPLQKAAKIEWSKGFARALLQKYGIEGNPRFRVFTSVDGMAEFLEELGDNYVVKADGLMGGKGVKVSGDHLHSHAEALAYAKECLPQVVIEEKLIGQEFSLMSFCDGRNTAEMPAVQDYKRAFEGNKGPNTGGMGSYSDANHSLPFLQPRDVEEAAAITLKVVQAILGETETLFQGVLYGGFIATAQGVRLIEYNARFGDPEALNVLPLLKTNFVDICEAIMNRDLNHLPVEFEAKATVCKYIVPKGYPEDSSCKGKQIEVGTLPEGVRKYYRDVDKRDNGMFLGSSRSIGFVGIGESIAEAEQLVTKACLTVKGPVVHRQDIGTPQLIGQSVKMMKMLRA